MKKYISIHYFTEAVSFTLKEKRKTSEWLGDVLVKEGKCPGEINYIFCSDKYLLALNREHLDHDTYTDIITFDYSGNAGNEVCSDIYISIERVKENAATYKVPFRNELLRVMVHGVLHLAGYKDKSARDQKEMRSKEEYYLEKF